MVFNATFNNNFSFIVAVSFIGMKFREKKNVFVILKTQQGNLDMKVRFMVFSATFNNISVKSWRCIEIFTCMMTLH